MAYCTISDLRQRLSEGGARWIADHDQDGGVSQQEAGDVLQSAVEYACHVLDAVVAPMMEPALAQSAENGWLRDRAIDLAAYRAAGHAGRDVPDSLQAAYEFSLKELDRIRDGGRIPDLIAPMPARRVASERSSVRVVNPSPDFG